MSISGANKMQIAFLGSKPVFRSADEIRHCSFPKQEAGEVVSVMLSSIMSKCVVSKVSLDLYLRPLSISESQLRSGTPCERHKMALPLVGFMTNGGCFH